MVGSVVMQSFPIGILVTRAIKSDSLELNQLGLAVFGNMSAGSDEVTQKFCHTLSTSPYNLIINSYINPYIKIVEQGQVGDAKENSFKAMLVKVVN